MTEFAELRERLVGELRAGSALHDDRVAAAMVAVPRHVFLPDVEPELAYRDEAVVTKSDAHGRAISSSSQPAIMTIMLEQLGVQPGHRVLEVGAGTGYNAALLGYLAGATGSVTTVDVDDDIASAAREHLAASGYGRVSVVHGDGGLGWPPGAPYDRIIATVGTWDILPAWLNQLKPGGRLVLPLAIRAAMQYSIAFERVAGHLESRSLRPCGFMRLRGAFAGPETLMQIGEGRNLFAEVGPRAPDAEELEALLDQPGERMASGITVTLGELWSGLGLWLAGHEPGLGRLSGLGVRSLPGPAAAIAVGGRMGAVMLVSAHGCAIATRPEDPGEPTGEDEEEAGPVTAAQRTAESRKPFELAAWPFGRDGAELAARLVQHAQDWQTAGRPSASDLSVSAYPAAKQETAEADRTDRTAAPAGEADKTGGTAAPASEADSTDETATPAGEADSTDETATPAGQRRAVIDKRYVRLTLSWRKGTGATEETSGCE